jgi:hypothetical protein
MKKVIYSGLNTKCLIFSASVLETQEFNEENAKRTMEWFVQQSIDGYTNAFNELYSNINIIKVESRPITFNGDNLFFNIYTVSYKLPERLSREILNIVQNKSLRSLKFPLDGPITYPMAGWFKCLSGDGSYTGKFVRKEGVEEIDSLQHWFLQQVKNTNRHNHPVLGIHTDTNGYVKYSGINTYNYGGLPQYQIEVAIYDNSADAINDKNGIWIKLVHLSTPGQDYGMAYGIRKCKINAYIEKGVLVISDNVNGISSIKDKIKENDQLLDNFDIITTNQYSIIGCGNGNILMATSCGGINYSTLRYKTMSFLLMNKDRIVDILPNNRNNYIDGSILYEKNKKNKLNFRVTVHTNYDMMCAMGDGMTFIIPFEINGDIHFKALDILHQIFSLHHQDDIDRVKDEYFYKILMSGSENLKDDVLMDWFRKCSATAKSDEEQLREAYKNLRDGLVREYQDIEKYLAANNFGDKKPVPSVRVEEEFKHSPLNKLAFSFDSETIDTINYTRLDKPVLNEFLSIDYMIPWVDRRGEKGFVKGRIPLTKFYDKTNNLVILNSNKIILEHMERMVRR